MRQFPHTKRNHRSGNWVYFRRIPSSAQALTGRTFFERSLRTADLNRLAEPWAAADRQFQSLVEDARQTSTLLTSGITPTAKGSQTTEYEVREEFRRWDGDVAATNTPLTLRLDHVKGAVRRWSENQRYQRAQRIISDPIFAADEKSFMEECQHVGACGQKRDWLVHSPYLYDLTRKILADSGIAVPPLHGTLHLIERMVQQELYDVLEAEGRWRRYDFSDLPSSPPAPINSGHLAPNGRPFISMRALAESFTSTTRKPKKTASKLFLVVKYIEELTQPNVSVDLVTKDVLIQLQKRASQIPARLTSAEKNISIVALSEQENNATILRAKLSPQAVRSWFNLLGGCFNWAVAADLINRNPTIGIKPKVNKLEERCRSPFSSEDLSKIFDKKIYPKPCEQSRYWIPILGLLTGARLNEIGQLHRSDVILGAIPLIKISDQAENDAPRKRLKNTSSRRLVPIHPIALEMGFLDFVGSHTAPNLFNDLPHNGSYEPTKAFSQWFGRYLKAAGVKTAGKVFHSFRHTFKDECRRRGIEEEVHDALTGHSSPTRSIGRSYGLGVPIERLSEAVSCLYEPQQTVLRTLISSHSSKSIRGRK